jgi:hypothetical protein
VFRPEVREDIAQAREDGFSLPAWLKFTARNKGIAKLLPFIQHAVHSIRIGENP